MPFGLDATPRPCGWFGKKYVRRSSADGMYGLGTASSFAGLIVTKNEKCSPTSVPNDRFAYATLICRSRPSVSIWLPSETDAKVKSTPTWNGCDASVSGGGLEVSEPGVPDCANAARETRRQQAKANAWVFVMNRTGHDCTATAPGRL